VVATIGEGGQGVITRAEVLSPIPGLQVQPKHVAIKKMRSKKGDKGVSREAIREIKFMRELSHPNVMGILEIYTYHRSIHMVLEYMKTDLDHVIHKGSVAVLGEGQVKAWLRMILCGVKYLHDSWILHRDLKPGNCLIGMDNVLKIADFGLAKQYGHPNEHALMSPQACTRWYRAPELLFGSTKYETGMDMWSVGCIFAELQLRTHLFTGKNEIDQLSKIFACFGTPTEETWPDVRYLPDYHAHIPCPAMNLKDLFPASSKEAIDLFRLFCTYYPPRRISAEKALEHAFFKTGSVITPTSELLPI